MNRDQFLKYANQRLDYIESTQRYLDSQAFEPYNMYKEAGAWDTIAHFAGDVGGKLFTNNLGSGLASVGKLLRSKPVYSASGKLLNSGATNSLLSRVGRQIGMAGLKLRRMGLHQHTRYLNDVGFVNSAVREGAKKMPLLWKLGNKAKSWAPGLTAGAAVAAGTLGVPGFKQLNNVTSYTTLDGLASKGLSYASDKIVGGINTIKNKAIDGAERAAMQTAQEMANGIYNQGRMAHMYGAMDPEAFRDRLLEQAQSGIRDRFTQLRGGQA